MLSATAPPHHALPPSWQIPLGFMVLADSEMRADPMYAQSFLGKALVLFSASYFAHDLFIVTLYFSEAGLGFFLHGFFCCGLYCYGAFYHQLQYFGELLLSPPHPPFCTAYLKQHSAGSSWSACGHAHLSSGCYPPYPFSSIWMCLDG